MKEYFSRRDTFGHKELSEEKHNICYCEIIVEVIVIIKELLK